MSSRKRQNTSSEAGPSQPSNPNKPWLDLGIELKDKTHQQRFLNLHQRTLISTRFIGPAHLATLGILEDVRYICEHIKFREFIQLDSQPTSRRLTLEFLSTLEREEVEDDNGAEYMEIRYQLMNKQFKDDYERLNALFHWPTDSPTAEMLAENTFEDDELVDESSFDLQTVWSALTNDPVFNARRSKSSHIIHPAVRYVHRLLVYSIWGRADLGAMSEKEMKCLWLITNPLIDQNRPFPINYAENFIDRMIDYRDGHQHKRDICMGGMVSIIALHRVPDFDMSLVDHIDEDYVLDRPALVTKYRWMTKPNSVTRRHTWCVGVGKNIMAKWIDLPNEPVTQLINQRRRDPFLIPRAYDPAPEEPQAAADEAAAPPSPPHTTHGGESSSSGGVPLQSLADQFDQFRLSNEAFQRRQMQESDYQMTYLRGIYAAGVNSGAITSPYMNFPMHPPQQGPVPAWHNNQPTYPYHPPRPEGAGYDYRLPGGSDPQYDPNYPPFDTYPAYPPNYHASVPPMEQSWGTAPVPNYGTYHCPPETSGQRYLTPEQQAHWNSMEED